MRKQNGWPHDGHRGTGYIVILGLRTRPMEAVLEEVPVPGAATDQVRKGAQELGAKTGWDGLVEATGSQPVLFF